MSSPTKKLSSISIKPINYADIPLCAQISEDAFATDPHTIVKNLGAEPYSMYEIATSMFGGNLERKNLVLVKAVDDETGELVGQAGWIFRNVDADKVPWVGPNDEKPPVKEEEAKPEEKKEEPEVSEPKEKTSIDRLKEMEDEDMQHWQSQVIPTDKPVMIIYSVTVSVAHQSRGIGSALLKYGNDIADELGVSIYVHSSHQAYEAYGKAGFEVTKVFDIDLDEWAPTPPKDDDHVMGEKGSGKWGHYIIRYMRRDPK